MSTIEKGSHKPLNVTQESHHRVFVGLGWDPKDDGGLIEAITDKISGKALHHDLDLACYIYDANNNLINIVSAEVEHGADETGRIYHSGDNVEGIGDGDDEQISVELKDIDPDICNIVFIATIKSGHSFSEIDAPEIRLVDGYSNREFIVAPLICKESEEKSGYVFLRLYPQNEAWTIHSIGEFFNVKDAGNLSEFLKDFID